MGRSIQPKYRVKMRPAGSCQQRDIGWVTRDRGRANAANLKKMVAFFNAAWMGGWTGADLINNTTGEVVARWEE
jgi:hypothetical protein